MVKFNKSMNEYLRSERTREKQKAKQEKVILGEYCRSYIRKHPSFDWFIKKYYGDAKVLELWGLAQQNEEEHLKNELNGIWFELPDNIFNIRNNPRGWEEFLSLVED